MKVRTAVFPVAGFGTRMLPATKSTPKEMLTLVDKPLIQYTVEEAVNAGIERVIFVTGRGKTSMEDHFDKSPELEAALADSGKDELLETVNSISDMCDVISVRQKEAKGLGHAVHCAKDIVGDEPFAVILPDDIILSGEPVTGQLIRQFERTQAPVISLMEVPEEDTSKYGIVQIDEHEDDRLKKLGRMVEKPKENPPSNLAIIGRYVLTPDIFEELEGAEAGAGGEIQLTDALHAVGKAKGLYGYLFEGRRFDCGNVYGYLEAILNYAADRDDLKQHLKKLISELKIS